MVVAIVDEWGLKRRAWCLIGGFVQILTFVNLELGPHPEFQDTEGTSHCVLVRRSDWYG